MWKVICVWWILKCKLDLAGSKQPEMPTISLPQDSRTTFKRNLTCIFLSGRLKLLFTFHHEIPCSVGNESAIDSGEYVTENSHTGDGDDTIDISEYEGGYSDGNEGCEVFI